MAEKDYGKFKKKIGEVVSLKAAREKKMYKQRKALRRQFHQIRNLDEKAAQGG